MHCKDLPPFCQPPHDLCIKISHVAFKVHRGNTYRKHTDFSSLFEVKGCHGLVFFSSVCNANGLLRSILFTSKPGNKLLVRKTKEIQATEQINTIKMHIPFVKVKRSPRLASFTSAQACQHSRLQRNKTDIKDSDNRDC